jgi:hypothetical protein
MWGRICQSEQKDTSQVALILRDRLPFDLDFSFQLQRPIVDISITGKIQPIIIIMRTACGLPAGSTAGPGSFVGDFFSYRLTCPRCPWGILRGCPRGSISLNGNNGTSFFFFFKKGNIFSSLEAVPCPPG